MGRVHRECMSCRGCPLPLQSCRTSDTLTRPMRTMTFDAVILKAALHCCKSNALSIFTLQNLFIDDQFEVDQMRDIALISKVLMISKE